MDSVANWRPNSHSRKDDLDECVAGGQHPSLLKHCLAAFSSSLFARLLRKIEICGQNSTAARMRNTSCAPLYSFHCAAPNGSSFSSALASRHLG